MPSTCVATDDAEWALCGSKLAPHGLGGVYGLFIFLIFAGLPRLNYLQAEHRCGHQPVIVDSFMGSSWYTLPGDSEYGVSFANSAYFCSERAAKEAGYTHH